MKDARNAQGELQPAVLVVDPSKVTLVAARKLLEPHFGVYLAEDGAAAWELLESIPEIAAVFTEQNLPLMDGNALLKKIRESADLRLADLPVIIITSGERQEVTRRTAIDAGATDFILKPFDPVDLVTRARAWSSTSQRANQLRQSNTTLRGLVLLDADTRAGNRDYFLQETIKDRCFCLRHGNEHSLLYISIDNLDRIQREQGRLAAREAVALVAEAIRAKCRREDTFARVTESAFALSLLQTPALGARVLAERIRQAISLKVFRPRGMTMTLTVSIGVSVPAAAADLTAEQMLEAGERAARQAIRAGGNQTCVEAGAKAADTGKKPSATTAIPTLVPTLTPELPLLNREAALANPEAFIAEIIPVLERLPETARLELIDRLLVMTETSSHV